MTYRLTWLLAILAAILPALAAYRTDVAKWLGRRARGTARLLFLGRSPAATMTS